MSGPLEGIRAVEVAGYVAGPFAAMILGDLGAEVIKVEAPPHGDPTRNREDDSGYSIGFAVLNRNKKSVFLDLHRQHDRGLFGRLIATADVLVTSVRPRARGGLSLDFDALAELNRRLVYLSLTGHGELAGSADLPAFDTTVQARSGLLDLIGASAGEPLRVKALLADQLAGTFGALGVLAALVERGRSGRGGLVRTSLLEAALGFNTLNHSLHLSQQMAGGHTRLRSAGFVLVAGDGLAFAVHVAPSPESHWRRFVETIGLPELLDDGRFATKALRDRNHALIYELVADRVRSDTRAHWLERLAAADLPGAPVHPVEAVFGDPLVAALGMVSSVAGPAGESLRLVGPGVGFGTVPGRPPARAPLAGEHTREVLDSLRLPTDAPEEGDGAGIPG